MWNLISMFVNANKIGGWVRSGVAVGLPFMLHRYPLLTDFMPLGAQDALVTILTFAAIGLWSHISKLMTEYQPRAGNPVGYRNVGQGTAFILAFMFFVLFAHDAMAQSLPSKNPPLKSPCTTIECTGWYAGASVANGIFAGDAGYQYWNGTAFLALEAGAGAQVYTDPALSNNKNGFFAYEIMKAGGSFAGLLGTTTVAPPNYPSISAHLIAPYAFAGAVERSAANGWTTGGGSEFQVSPYSFVDLKYFYVNYGANRLPPESIIMASWNFKF